MLTLYMAGNSICTQKVLITLHEKRLPWDAVNLDLFNNEQYSPALSEDQSEGRGAVAGA